jgi:hypothetical protein
MNYKNWSMLQLHDILIVAEIELARCCRALEPDNPHTNYYGTIAATRSI